MGRGADVRTLFEPRSVAIFGATPDRDKIGFKILDNLVSGGFKGEVYPINPKGGEVLGLKIYKSLDEVEGDVDMGIIAIPAKFVFDALRACAMKGVRHVPIISSGFSEIGNGEEERAMARFARENGMRILGPNIFGIYSRSSSFNATFGPKDVTPGGVAIITQSGALGIAMIGKSAVENVGLSCVVSMGNKADIDEADLLDYIAEDDNTKIVLMYIEGVQNGEKLIASLRKFTMRKPVVVIKSGRSKRGAMAAASHTGSLAGSDAIFDAVMRQCGVMRAETLKDAFNWCKFISYSATPKGENAVIVTNGGGIGVLATDACEKHGVRLYDDQQVLKNAFGKVTPEFGSTKNPIDLTGQATPEFYDDALQAGIEGRTIDSVVGLYCETAVFDPEGLKRMIADAYRKYAKAGKPVVFSIVGGHKVETCISSLSKDGIPIFPEVYEAVSCLGASYAHRKRVSESEEPMAEVDIDVDAIGEVASKARAEGRYFLLSNEAQEVMRAAGIQLPKSRIAKSMEEAVRFAKGIGYPVVMKVVSKDIVHKSDVGGVALGIDDEREVVDAYQAIMQSCKSHDPTAVIEGIQVDEMVRDGTEIIVGARRDGGFGPVVMCGLGGIYVEVMKDVAFRAFPLSRKEAMSMIKEIKTYQLLLGARGEERKDIEGVIETLIKLGTIIKRCRGISDIEVNPVMVYESGKGVKAVDVRILLSKQEAG
ncbi:MAG: acetate--CoA ligase family protein [Methanobacteriota archaeon]